MTTTKVALYQAHHIRSCEQMAKDQLKLTEHELMARAGAAAFAVLKKLYPAVRRIAVFCGCGNNAGDGYVLARLAWKDGYSVVVHQYKTIEVLPPVAQEAALAAITAGVDCQPLEDVIDSDVELIVDALFGIGLNRTISGALAIAINQINESGLPILALDLPSGLEADTGYVMGACIRATTTVAFIALKLGMMTLEGPDYCGEVICDSLQLENCLSDIVPAAYLLDKNLCTLLSRRRKNTHKGDFGHVLIIGGGYGMPGSVCLAAQAALRVGAGIVTIATRPEYAMQVLPMLPEAMIYGIDEVSSLLPLIARATVCVIGPGLGEDEWAMMLFAKVIASQLPMVIDASALRILSQNPQYDDNWVLTPHPGEAASLLHTSTAEIQANRYQAAMTLQRQYGGNIVLKGAGSIVCTDEPGVYLCGAGNPGMASPGMGDVLSGIVAGLIAQGLSLAQATQLGVWLHASAADEAACMGERGLLASDLMNCLRRQVNGSFTNEF